MTGAQYAQVLASARATLLALPNVVGVGIGSKVVAGTPTHSTAICVYVTEKKPASQLAPNELVPATIAGVPTDVISVGRTRQADLCEEDHETDDDKQRPLQGGYRLETRLPDGPLQEGTIGFIGRTRPGVLPFQRIVATTCYHVLYQTPTQVAERRIDLREQIGQPDAEITSTGCANDQISKHIVKGVFNETADIAMVEILAFVDGNDPSDGEDDRAHYVTDIREIAPVTGIDDPGTAAGEPPGPTAAQAAARTYKVMKYGITTGLTRGTVTTVGYSGENEGRAFTGSFVVESDDAEPFALPGDSGAAVLQYDPAAPNGPKKIVGILHTITCDDGHGIVEPITVLMDALGADPLFDAPESSPQPVPGTTHAGDPQVIVELAAGAAVPASLPSDAARLAQSWRRQIERDLGATLRGRELFAIAERHHREVVALVNTNRKAMVEWHRLGGPHLMRGFFRLSYDPRYRLPATNHGAEWSASLKRAYALLDELGSEQLRRDLRRCQCLRDVRLVAGMKYRDVIQAIVTSDQADVGEA